ncbi:MAG: hypothetical protein IKI31_04020, partial [Treponema sp.]|nr:hypothetical protein [Treponema sp.]
MLYSARNSFTSGDYASALKYAEEAKVFRKNQVSSHIHSLEQAFKPREVQRKNDSLKDIILVLEKRDDFKALDIIHFYLQKKSVSDFKNSAATLLSHISMRKEFPEADWIIGSVYKLEGEYELSREYLLTAWKNSFLLDVPDEQFSILYELAELEKLQNNLDDYEKYLLLVLQNDKYFNNASFSSATSNIINMKKDDSFEKFFLMFRSDNYKALKAYSLLSDYYTSL